jgi:L-lactate utilization protein LutB
VVHDARFAASARHRAHPSRALGNYEIARDKRKARSRSWESARQAAAETKVGSRQPSRPISRRVCAKLEARGTKVHWASTGAQAREIISASSAKKGALHHQVQGDDLARKFI